MIKFLVRLHLARFRWYWRLALYWVAVARALVCGLMARLLEWRARRVGVACRFCGAAAVGIFTFDEGCLCFPDDRVQALCAQHVLRASPLGSMDRAVALRRDVLALLGW